MNAQLYERVRSIAADVLQVSATSITQQSSTENVESWDSVHHLNLVLALEQEFDLQFDPEEMDHMHSISHILQVLDNKLNHRSS
ncbi:MAG TPA: acyl carrier protein [Terriglobales bacterium]|nr:acyl carrier protein [Terriglobales bacterium]